MESHYTNKTLEEVASIARCAIPMATEHGLPITPETYSVLYAFVAQDNDALCNEISRLIAEREQLTLNTIHYLYQHYLVNVQEQSMLLMRDELRSMILATLETLRELDSETSALHKGLNRTAQRLTDEPCSLEDLRHLVETLRDETTRTATTGDQLRQRLQHAQREIDTLKQDCQRARRESLIDPLTGILNRRGLEQQLAALCQGGEPNCAGLGVLMIDIDHFKRINDKFGHVVGDEVLKYIAMALRDSVRGADVVARYGGEEFAILLPNTTKEGALRVAHNIRARVSAAPLRLKSSRQPIGVVTLSVGIARYTRGLTQESLIELADKALYAAKQGGRNRVVCVQAGHFCTQGGDQPCMHAQCRLAG